jgi:type IV pilus assembly protein PilX
MKNNLMRARGSHGGHAAQRGIVLIVALIVLVVMSLAGLLMFRASGTGVQIAGNIGFKQNATALGDLGVEAGRAYLMGFATNAIPLNTDDATSGYYASWNDAFDPLNATTFDWNSAKEVVADDGTGNRVRYVIHRLCKIPGASNAPGQQCAIPSSGSALGTGGGGASGAGFSGLAGQPYYRVTARVDGPRSTVSYVQVIMF